jgi:hypothetical protein
MRRVTSSVDLPPSLFLGRSVQHRAQSHSWSECADRHFGANAASSTTSAGRTFPISPLSNPRFFQRRRRPLASPLPRDRRARRGRGVVIQARGGCLGEALHCGARRHPFAANADRVEPDALPVGPWNALHDPAEDRGEVRAADLGDFLDSQEFFVGYLDHGTRPQVCSGANHHLIVLSLGCAMQVAGRKKGGGLAD